MRIISGVAKGKRLSSFTGKDIRPTPDRVRGALFSIVFSRLGDLNDKSVLDLFAGTGAMGIEALSRGASRLVAVDQGRQSAEIIPKNLKHCGLDGSGTFISADALTALPRVAKQGPFDLIFLDPPYDMGLAVKTLEEISHLNLLKKHGLICAETSQKEELPDTLGSLEKIDDRIYASTRVHLYTHNLGHE